MTELNSDQFGSHGPQEDEYPRYDDYLADKRRYDRAKATGKTYHDPSEAIVSQKRKADEKQVKDEWKPEHEAQQAVFASRLNKMKMISKGLSAMGMKPATRRRGRK